MCKKEITQKGLGRGRFESALITTRVVIHPLTLAHSINYILKHAQKFKFELHLQP